MCEANSRITVETKRVGLTLSVYETHGQDSQNYNNASSALRILADDYLSVETM